MELIGAYHHQGGNLSLVLRLRSNKMVEYGLVCESKEEKRRNEEDQ
ncbi:hypothetical protein PAECIP111890_03019 [Paenibacillus sp. JJ-223]|nr:hypothetical protein PAECIP111890_03019 [Paenibacillus sp. JJ-223]